MLSSSRPLRHADDAADRAADRSSAAELMLASLLEARTGQKLGGRSWRIAPALKPLLRERGLDTIDALVTALLDGRDPDLSGRVLDALLNQESSFFRDAAVFDQVGELLAEMTGIGRRPRIWSAACSTGQEPLSVAMLASERDLRLDLVATDVSEGALGRARAGRYTQFEIQRGLSVHRMMRWFDGTDTEWTVRPELLNYISYRRCNLASDPPPSGRFDLVLCRNVLMYLTPEARAQAYARLAAALRAGGYLVLGAGETTIGQTEAFVPSRRYRGFYERVEA